MRFEGSVAINAPIDKVWASLTDPNVVSQCAPGLKSMDIIEPDKRFNVVASIGFGAVKVNFDADVEFVELKPPTYAMVKAHGKAPGSAVDVASDMHLLEGPDGTTTLDWTANVVVVGSIAGLASRLMSGITKQLSAQFFNCIKGKIEGARVEA